ncbi:MAG: 50S ribosomal protein L18 [Candidatus Brennerbacteria bacterium CG11_big_fil_rev_8_21_14_0_20_43_10]|uniref:Large ribosomal subunit protein uL18 n=3 Tax=Candidatus Brenneribacteriota TaxID=1817902 RepID=A0A2M8C347_9BACT|nr:MAG: 50S ribosomal protein L18 [Parcubacteria group bacterium CG1_02_44_31]PIP50449.1 MAG: 50S ribosomal protein L18 [Candidatus Brennerbacteria bacterium CG23_combo_of_CG06-09_8_20_14_all_44_41]PIR26169.1 MAG: 50S ribosomal protein L18 [Candidatus Brennerbacteria bacterium CG11_big_fil_rev_8_21_14_0_20_43_10]PIX28745.1 MAG: 50S ribosomal protein L18 [Candidatus Brennerbacteria bacterium CG_4_8_14_3_um_filter_43_14]PJA19870.1 MAG: 50S ribosomal protein L18 [Candidatus Brennerbacteria bacteri
MINKQKQKRIQKERRHARIRSKVSGTSERPRISIFRSHMHMYAQVIDDSIGKTLVSVTDKGMSSGESVRQKKTERAFVLGKEIARRAKEKGIKSVVFDTGGNTFHGRVKQFADGAREGGLVF